MAKLKRDERVCPFCAETIKAAATRCRYCQSDLPPLVESENDPEPAPVSEAKPDAAIKASAVEVPADSSTSPGPRKSWPIQRQLTLALAALVALAAVGVGTLWWHAEHSSSAVASNGSLVGDDARTQLLVAAADLTQRTLSYDYKTLANDMEVARKRMTPSFRKEYDATMAQVRANTTKNQIVLRAVAVSSAIINATEHTAKVLVFVNQTTTAGVAKTANQQLTRNSLVVTLTRGEGDWAMSKLTALG